MILYGKNKLGRFKFFFFWFFGVGYLYIWCVFKNYFKEIIIYDYGYVCIIYLLFVVKIDGLLRVFMGNESFVILDGLVSYDLVERYKKVNSFLFIWFCRREGVLQKDKDEILMVYLNDICVCYGIEIRYLNSFMFMFILDLGRLSGNNIYVFEFLVQKGDRLI